MKANLNQPKDQAKSMTLSEVFEGLITHANKESAKAQKNNDERKYYFYAGIVSGVEAVRDILSGKYSKPLQ